MHDTQLATLLRSILVEHDLELEELQIKPIGKRQIVSVTVDGEGPHGRGPLLDDITAASQHISQVLDEVNYGGSRPYTLEVSSRGVSKPLTEPKHFRRNLGRLVKVRRHDESTDLVGRIISADDATVVLDINGTEQTINHSDIAKAVVQVELNRPAPELDIEDEINEEN